ncbi:trypco2 family protein [Embleya sp. NPDC020630]|uniref:trypco2 family protein n=1 Tax=Embleya sp. NPDC020630 TaxID=3363979 RepID=UPI0037AE978A
MGDAEGFDGLVDLADAITLLREQIAEAQSRIAAPGADKGVRLTVEEITLQLGLELTEAKGVTGGLRWSVISLGGKKDTGRKTTHTVTMKLASHGPDGRRTPVRDVE